MEYRNLGRTGIQVSVPCLGCMMFGDRTGEQESLDIIDYAIDHGINFLDTANVYSRGGSEEMVGKALQRNRKRRHIILATKVHGTMDDADPNAKGNSRRHIIEQCEASLRRLQTDYIDLYQIHRPSSNVPIDETLRALDDLVRAGKVRYIGSSVFATWQVMESLWVSKELGLNRFVSEQPPYHLLDRHIERELIPMAITYGIGIITWSPLAGGFFTGKYRRGDARPQGARFTESYEWADKHFIDKAFDVLEVIEKIAAEKSCKISQLALAWCSQQPGITTPIIGPRNMEQLKDNLGAAEVKISDEDRARIDVVSPACRELVSYHDADLSPHQFRW